jgi:hypothetical protein
MACEGCEERKRKAMEFISRFIPQPAAQAPVTRSPKQAGLPPGWPQHRPSWWRPSAAQRLANADDGSSKR